jgi:hypothetical protein
VDRVVSQSRGIVPIGIAAGDTEDPLPQQVADGVLDLAFLASLGKACGQTLTQAQRGVAGLQQDRPAVGAAVLLIELSPQRPGKQMRKQNRLSCDIVAQAKASRVTEVLVVQPFLSQKRLLLFSHSRAFANFSG